MISGALTLLTNAAVASNTWKLYAHLAGRLRTGKPLPSDAILAHIAPIAFRHINSCDNYRIPVQRYADQLVTSLPGA